MLRRFWPWLWVSLGVLYFFLPIYATFVFSLKAKKGIFSLLAYDKVFADPRFGSSFVFSTQMALLTIFCCMLLLIPTLTVLHLFLRRLRPVVEFVALVPFVIPSVVLVFGYLRVFARPPLSITNSTLGTYGLLLAGYMVLSMPYMYRSIDAGLRAIDLRTLVEASQSLGAGWLTIFVRVIFPNIRVAVLNGSFVTFAIVIGELTMARFLLGNAVAFAPYLAEIGRARAYEPAAITVLSLLMTWGIVMILQLLGRNTSATIAGPR